MSDRAAAPRACFVRIGAALSLASQAKAAPRRPSVERYYSGVAHPWTTICCSAVALTALYSAAAHAQPPTPRPHPSPPPREARAKTPPAFVPTRALWTLALNSQLAVPPAYDAMHVYFALAGDRLVAYTVRDGKRLWIVQAHPLLQPAAGDDLVFLVEAAGLVARRATDGSVAWQLALSDPPAVAPVFDNGWLIVATKGGQIGALRAKDGTIVWQRSLGSPAHAPASLADDRVYVSTTDGRLVTVRVDTGEPVWERRLSGSPNEILVSRDRLYVGTTDNFFYCVMSKDGIVDWRWRTGGDVVGQPVTDGKYVFFVALDNVLRAMDRRSGAQVWMRPLPVRPMAGAVLAGSSVVVAGQPAQLRVFTAKDGTPAPGEPIVPGAPAPPALTISSSYFPGADIPIVPLSETELSEKLPSKIPAEVEVDKVDAPKPAAIADDAESAAPPHLLEDPLTHLPIVMMLTRDIARGAGVTLVTREFEPTVSPLAPLPNMIMIAPQTGTISR
ncbi:MAG TPA: PQQ-binding-like beta-propeller repeat protein [Vicinamibacterales bacterium]|nr:PQQ-binding-like beta-propeller repeat protein [Vicinamibacterales bacterium]